MKMTGTDIRTQEFPKKLRGYDTLDVIAFLQKCCKHLMMQLKQRKKAIG